MGKRWLPRILSIAFGAAVLGYGAYEQINGDMLGALASGFGGVWIYQEIAGWRGKGADEPPPEA